MLQIDAIVQFIDYVGGFLEEGSFYWTAVFVFTFLVTIIYFFRGLYIYKKRVVESAYFMVFCLPIILWSFLLAAGPILGIDNAQGSQAGLGIYAAELLVPVLLMFHVWSQVSYKPIRFGDRFFWLFVPIALFAFEAFDFYDPNINLRLIFYGQITVLTLVANMYYLVVIIKSYLLCFNVMYQMPKHMRYSTFQVLVAISALLFANIISLYFSAPQHIHYIILAIAYIVIGGTLLSAFFRANSSNVIATSRDFVFSSLSTLVITVSLKGSILDWNKKEKGACFPLPDPKYKEPYKLYRKRIIETCNGTVSPHDDNILNIVGKDGETSYLFIWHDISYMDRKFGYLVEISEVTKSQTKLRYIEAIAYYDNLTMLHNRNAYMEMVKGIVEENNLPLLILVGDVNNLKKINDTLGHLLGDKLLLVITGVVKKKAPERAFVARIGGDELCLLIPNAGEEEARHFINEVTSELDSIRDEDIGTPSISWGFSVMYNTDENYNEVFRTADAMMYDAKQKTKEISISGFVPQ